MTTFDYKALVLAGRRRLRIETRKAAPLAPDQVRVKMAAVGVCGSDMHYFETFGNVGRELRHPLILGHEAAGVVTEVGADARRLRPGDKVVINPLHHCGVCPACRRGELSQCDDARFPGSALTVPHVDGFFREYFETAERCCIAVPADTDLSVAALADPLACSLHALARAGGAMGARVLVAGTGSVGAMAVAASRLGGAERIVVAGRRPGALAIAGRMGADELFDATSGKDLASLGPFDIVVESTGAPRFIAEGMRALRKGGVLVQLGSPPGGEIAAPWSLFMEKEIRVVGAMRWNNEFDAAVAFILNRRLDPTPILTGRFGLDEGEAAFAAAADHGRNMKVQFVSRGGP